MQLREVDGGAVYRNTWPPPQRIEPTTRRFKRAFADVSGCPSLHLTANRSSNDCLRTFALWLLEDCEFAAKRSSADCVVLSCCDLASLCCVIVLALFEGAAVGAHARISSMDFFNGLVSVTLGGVGREGGTPVGAGVRFGRSAESRCSFVKVSPFLFVARSDQLLAIWVTNPNCAARHCTRYFAALSCSVTAL